MLHNAVGVNTNGIVLVEVLVIWRKDSHLLAGRQKWLEGVQPPSWPFLTRVNKLAMKSRFQSPCNHYESRTQRAVGRSA